MKKIENTFTVTGFVGKDAEIRSFTSASVARFSLAVGRQEKSGDQTSRISAFLNFEAMAQKREQRVFRLPGQRYLAYRGGLFQARKMDRQRRHRA